MMPNPMIKLGKKGGTLRPAAQAKGFISGPADGFSAVTKLADVRLPCAGTGKKAGSAVNG